MSIAEHIAELERDLELYREADRQLGLWKLVFDASSDEKKKEMLVDMLKDRCGFSEEDVTKMLLPLTH